MPRIFLGAHDGRRVVACEFDELLHAREKVGGLRAALVNHMTAFVVDSLILYPPCYGLD